MKIPSRIKRKRNIKIKKSTIGVFVAFFAFAFSMFYVFAGENNKLTVEKLEAVSRGEEITVRVALECEKAYNVGGFQLNFNPEVLEYSDTFLTPYINPSASNKNKVSLSSIAPSEEEDIAAVNASGELYIGFLNLDGTKAACESMEDFAEITFNVKADAPGGKSSITISNQAMAKEISGEEREDITVDTEDGYVVVALPVNLASVRLEQTEYEIQKGSNATLTVLYDATTDEPNTTYLSGNTDVVTVSDSGVMTAVDNGDTTVTVTAFGKEMIATVTVSNHITSVTITGAKHDLSKGETLQLTGAVTPNDTSDSKTLTWTSSNTDVATVDEDGLVTAKAGGEATIQAKSVNNVTDTYLINVVVPMEEFTTTDANVALNKGETKTITTSITPSDTTENTTITWSTNNSNVATVNANGVVTAVGGGTATITGTLENEKSVTVTVVVSVPITNVTIDEDNIELVPTQSQTLIAAITPDDQTEAEGITWESNNEAVATVDENGKVTAVAPGNAVITATAGSKSATTSVKVLIPIESFVISEPSVTLNRNESATLTVTILPNEAEESKEVTWTSSDSTSVSVDQNGVITGLKGTQTPVTITGTLPNGKTVTSEVTVVVLIDSIEINKTSATLNKGTNETLEVTVNPEDTSEDTTPTWESNHPEIASVDANGKVTAVAAGNAVITVRIGTHEKTCAITVVVPITDVVINSEDITLDRGATATLTATVNPEDATEDKTVTWSSNKTSVATVDNNGVVTAVSAGEATITATAGGKTDTIKVTVIVPITNFTVNKTELSLVKGKSETLSTTITPSDTTENTTITWSSNKTNIATVDANGKVEAKAEGNAVITGTLENGMSVTVSVTVTIIPVTSITVSNKTLDMKKNDTKTLTVTWEPADATEIEDIVWTSSDSTVATVDEDGVVTAKKAGTATITAKMGSLTDTSEVTVTEVHLEDITLEENATKADVGKPYQVKVTFDPVDATDDVTYEYETSDPEIATIDADGNVTSKKPGTVTITVKATANGQTYTKTITLTFNTPASANTGVMPIWAYVVMIVALIGTALVIYKKKILV